MNAFLRVRLGLGVAVVLLAACASGSQQGAKSKTDNRTQSGEYAATAGSGNGVSRESGEATGSGGGTEGAGAQDGQANESESSGEQGADEAFAGAVAPTPVAGINLLDCGLVPLGVNTPRPAANAILVGCRVLDAKTNGKVDDAVFQSVSLRTKGQATRISLPLRPSIQGVANYQALVDVPAVNLTSNPSIEADYDVKGLRHTSTALVALPIFVAPELGFAASASGPATLTRVEAGGPGPRSHEIWLTLEGGSFPASRIAIGIEADPVTKFDPWLAIDGGSCFSGRTFIGWTVVPYLAKRCSIVLHRSPLKYVVATSGRAGLYGHGPAEIPLKVSYFDGSETKSLTLKLRLAN